MFISAVASCRVFKQFISFWELRVCVWSRGTISVCWLAMCVYCWVCGCSSVTRGAQRSEAPVEFQASRGCRAVAALSLVSRSQLCVLETFEHSFRKDPTSPRALPPSRYRFRSVRTSLHAQLRVFQNPSVYFWIFTKRFAAKFSKRSPPAGLTAAACSAARHLLCFCWRITFV